MNKLTTNDALHSAVAEKKLKLLKILLEGGSEVNRRAYDGKTALMIICCNFGVDHNEEYIIGVIQLLLKHKADPNVQDRKGRTAIMYAVRNLKPKTAVNLLLKHGADPLICDNFGKNAISCIRTEYWSQYKDSFNQYVEPAKQQYIVVPTTTFINDKYIDKIKACRSSQTVNEIKNKARVNNIYCRCSDDVFCPHSAPPIKEDAVTGEHIIVHKISHIPSYMNEDISCTSMMEEAEFGNARQERVNSDPTTERKSVYQKHRTFSLEDKQRRQRPLRRHSSQEASTMFMLNKDDGGRTLMFKKNGCTSNSATDMSLMDKNILKHGVVRCFRKLPPIEKIPK
ncbi:unnamed protein product [Mytilus coruscus]|uniref:Uncharacterized protein n=1 Tax=Mytilus coruscus TaxID=42192 RepID=A0A6J8B8V3_MYTCO|nr:unnamed protein product [Mytilus coruscus]